MQTRHWLDSVQGGQGYTAIPTAPVFPDADSFIDDVSADYLVRFVFRDVQYVSVDDETRTVYAPKPVSVAQMTLLLMAVSTLVYRNPELEESKAWVERVSSTVEYCA